MIIPWRSSKNLTVPLKEPCMITWHHHWTMMLSVRVPKVWMVSGCPVTEIILDGRDEWTNEPSTISDPWDRRVWAWIKDCVFPNPIRSRQKHDSFSGWSQDRDGHVTVSCDVLLWGAAWFILYMNRWENTLFRGTVTLSVIRAIQLIHKSANLWFMSRTVDCFW